MTASRPSRRNASLALAALSIAAPVGCGGGSRTADAAVDAASDGPSDTRDGAIRWSAASGGPTRDDFGGLAVDPTGAVVFSGSYADPSASADTLYAAKLDPSGASAWGRTLVPTTAGRRSGVAIDADGNVFVTGGFTSSVTLAGVSATAVGGTDAFVTKLDPIGNPVWAVLGGAAGNAGDEGRRVAVTPSGDIVVLGRFEAVAGQPFTFGGKTVTGAGGSDLFIARLDASGKTQSLLAFGGPEDEEPAGLTVTATGDLVVVGGFRAKVDFGIRTVTAEMDVDAFVLRLDASGKPLWLRHGSGDGADHFGDVASDGASLFVIGESTGKHFKYDGMDVARGGVMVLSLDGEGAIDRYERGSSQTSVGLGIAARGDRVVITGKVSGADDLGGAKLPEAPDYAKGDAFVILLDGGLAAKWSMTAHSDSTGAARAAGFAADGSFATGGIFTGSAVVAANALFAAGGTGDTDVFVARFPATP